MDRPCEQKNRAGAGLVGPGRPAQRPGGRDGPRGSVAAELTQEVRIVIFVYVSPTFPDTAITFCEHLAAAGVTVLGLGDSWELPERLQRCLTEYYRVDSLHDYEACHRAIGHFTHRHGHVDWIESNNEYWLGLDAALRTDFNVGSGFHVD